MFCIEKDTSRESLTSSLSSSGTMNGFLSGSAVVKVHLVHSEMSPVQTYPLPELVNEDKFSLDFTSISQQQLTQL